MTTYIHTYIHSKEKHTMTVGSFLGRRVCVYTYISMCIYIYMPQVLSDEEQRKIYNDCGGVSGEDADFSVCHICSVCVCMYVCMYVSACIYECNY